MNLFSKDEIISCSSGYLPNHNSTFLIFADYLYSTYGFSLLILLYKSMYSANILNLNSYGCDGSIVYSTSASSSFYGSFFMCGWRNAKYSVFLMFSISSCSPSSVIRILSALNKLITSNEYGVWWITRWMLRCASAKLPSVFSAVITQNNVLSSDEYFSRIFVKIFVFGSAKLYDVTILILPSTSFAEKRAFKALSLIFAFKWYE